MGRREGRIANGGSVSCDKVTSEHKEGGLTLNWIGPRWRERRRPARRRGEQIKRDEGGRDNMGSKSKHRNVEEVLQPR